MIPSWPPEPRYGDAWKNLKAAMCEAYIYELLQKIGKEMNEDA